MRSSPTSPPTARPLDPALYARLILLLDRGARAQAIEVAQQELGLQAADAEATVDALWQSRQAEVFPSELDGARRHVPFVLGRALLVAVPVMGAVALLIWRLLS